MLLVTIGRLRLGGEAAANRYAAAVMPLIASAGGEVISRASPLETIVGSDERRPHLVAVMRFPTADAIRQFLDSSDYRAQIGHRTEAFEEVTSYIAADLMA